MSYSDRWSSYTTSDFQSVNFKPPRQTAGPEFYDRSELSRKVGLVGVAVAALFGFLCIIAGFMIFISKNTLSAACTEATGFVHGIALRSALASQQRLRFNTNLRLLSASDGWFNPNGTACNVLMAILLIVSYSSNLLVTLSVDLDSSSVPNAGHAMCVAEVPLFVLGVAIELQAIIALASVRSADILTWSSSAFDITAALVHHAQIIPQPGRCMYGICDAASRGPVSPSPRQPSAWRAHSSVRKVVLTLWALVVIYIVWGVIVVSLSDRSMSDAVKSWSFFPASQTHVVAYSIPIEGGVYWYWGLYYINMAAIQGPLTVALHCSELVANVVRDERLWRKATTKVGTTISSHPLAPVFGSPLNATLLAVKPVVHWMLGLAFSLAGTAENGLLTAIAVSMWPFQILNYAGALLVFALTFTIVALLPQSGPQPAAYGHVQTLANLIDEWSPTMWWGQKSNGLPYRHAGTSDYRLPKVDMNALYA
ncbi:hypothetical protein JVU11DRAFT_1336 [Chiua virens]|nr:hypothetical protein JVU11DRAFT_1336 [Chiua virens]